MARANRVGRRGGRGDVSPLDATTRSQRISRREPMDKAGAYGIQGYGATIVERVDGDYFAVMGLASNRLVRLLARLDSATILARSPPTVRRAPPLDAIEHVAHGDARHAVDAILHADRIVLAGLAVRIDDEVVETSGMGPCASGSCSPSG